MSGGRSNDNSSNDNSSNKNKEKSNSEDVDFKSNSSDEHCPCAVTRSLKSFMSQWRKQHPDQPLSIQQAILYMSTFRSQRVHHHVSSPIGSIKDHAQVCVKMINMLRRYDVNHILILKFVSASVSGVPQERVIAKTLHNAAIQWAEMIIVKSLSNKYVMYIFVHSLMMRCLLYNVLVLFVFCFVFFCGLTELFLIDCVT